MIFITTKVFSFYRKISKEFYDRSRTNELLNKINEIMNFLKKKKKKHVLLSDAH